METAAPQDPPVEPKPTSDEQMNDSSTSAIASATPQPGMLDTADDEGAINEAGGGSTAANNTNSFTSPPNNQTNDGLGSGIRPIFLGNLSHSALSSDVEHMFRNPVSRGSTYGTNGEEKEEGMASEIAPFDLDRVVSFYVWLYVMSCVYYYVYVFIMCSYHIMCWQQSLC